MNYRFHQRVLGDFWGTQLDVYNLQNRRRVSDGTRRARLGWMRRGPFSTGLGGGASDKPSSGMRPIIATAAAGLRADPEHVSGVVRREG